MKLHTLLPCLPSGTDDTEIVSVVTDSGKAGADSLFVCIRGLHSDGHDYLTEAYRKGCRTAVVEAGHPLPELPQDLALFPVPDTRAACAAIYDRFWGEPAKGMKLIAVTGTNGKTTVSTLLSGIYRQAGFSPALIGTVTHTLTTPDPADLYRILAEERARGRDTVIMEASSHALALKKLAPLRPDYGIFTNLTPEHLDFHGTMERYLEAKKTLFCMSRIGILNLDDEYGRQMARGTTSRNLFYSVSDDRADFTAKNVHLRGVDGVRYDCLTKDHLFRVTSPIPGRFTVYNTLAAAACAFTDGIRDDLIRTSLAGTAGIPGRMERVPLPGQEFSVYIDFAHTPDALENVLGCIRDFLPKGGRLTVLFGCGGDRDPSKRAVMGEIASRLADFVIVTSDNTRTENRQDIIDAILSGILPETPHVVIENRAEAIDYAVRSAQPGEILLLAGKGHETYEIDKNGKHPFSERELVRKAYEKRFR